MAPNIFQNFEVQRMAEVEFAKGQHPVAEELWKAQRTYCGLKDPRGMRCDALNPGLCTPACTLFSRRLARLQVAASRVEVVPAVLHAL